MSNGVGATGAATAAAAAAAAAASVPHVPGTGSAGAAMHVAKLDRGRLEHRDAQSGLADASGVAGPG